MQELESKMCKVSKESIIELKNGRKQENKYLERKTCWLCEEDIKGVI